MLTSLSMSHSHNLNNVVSSVLLGLRPTLLAVLMSGTVLLSGALGTNHIF